MTLFTTATLGFEVNVDEDYADTRESWGVDAALEYGYDERFPIVVDQDGLIIDGNHRFVAFTNEGRTEELVFVVVDYNEFISLQSTLIDADQLDQFNSDDEFFYSEIFKIAK